MQFMNMWIDNITREEAIMYIEKCITERKIMHIITPNVNWIIRIEEDPYFGEICRCADLSLTDGHPMLWIAKWYGTPIKEKISGSDFTPTLCQVAAEKGYSVFLLGAAPGVAKKAAEKLKERFPRLQVAGTYSPPWGYENDPEEIGRINKMLSESHADILFVGMGVPKQEIFVYENMQKYQIPVSISVGATIDFIAGEQKRAPKWMTDHGLEWFFRFTQEPKRMFKRYFVDDMKIFKLAWRYRKNAEPNNK